jgi:predicted lipid-binding transport protein (Tim44 family)
VAARPESYDVQVRWLGLLTSLAVLVVVDSALAQAGGGSSGFGGGGGGSGGGGGGFGGGGPGGGDGGDGIGALVVVAIVAVVVLTGAFGGWRYRRKVRARAARVRAASAEAAEDDAYFAADQLEREARDLFVQAQAAWDARDRARLAELVGPDLLVEWNRRLDDFDRKGWHNRVSVTAEPVIQYVGLTNREDDTEDLAVVRIEAVLSSYVEDRRGETIMRTGESDELVDLCEYWTLARRDDRWTVVSIDQKSEGDHHLDAKIVASPWSDDRLRDEALTELAVADKVPEGFTPADIATVSFDGAPRTEALDLSLADARFSPDVLEVAARRAVEAWAAAVDGDDAALEAMTTRGAIRQLLYRDDARMRTRVVVRGPLVKQIRITRVDAEHEPARMSIEVEVRGRRYVEDRDTAAMLSGSKDRDQTFVERWTLALDGPDESPWRLIETSAAAA